QRQDKNRQLVACLGDSNTQGTMAYNFVNELATSMGEEGYDFINAGVNGDLVYNVLNRLDEVIICDPDYIIILIGTNDILAQLNKPNEIKFELKKHLPMKPNEAWFISNLTAVISKLKANTRAKIAILSLPLISEDTDSFAFKQAIEYSQQIQKIAQLEQITYLPLNEWQLKFLEENRESKRKKVKTSPFAFFMPSFKHYVLRKSWEEISQEAGLILTVDTVHQNKIAASMIEQLIRSFLETEE
ncbi:SGNH/GDSL hydrolase family protein, partial [Turicibacter sanguinis]|nr:SGNH/GDSL hydrolase family protein [Turicibacter sanguinis]